MQILLGVVVLFALLWVVALRPKSGGGSSASTPTTSAAPTAPGVNGLTNDVQKAHGAAATSQANSDQLDQASQGAGAGTASTPSTPSSSAANTPAGTSASGSTTPGSTTSAGTAKHVAKHATAKHAATKHAAGKHDPRLQAAPPVIAARGAGPKAATKALDHHRVLALLFFNPRAADDRDVRVAFGHMNRHHGHVVAVAASLANVSDFDAVTEKVAVTGSPTFVVFNRRGEPTKLVGLTDRTLMNQRVADALAKQ